jgi:hypothetical protein
MYLAFYWLLLFCLRKSELYILFIEKKWSWLTGNYQVYKDY